MKQIKSQRHLLLISATAGVVFAFFIGGSTPAHADYYGHSSRYYNSDGDNGYGYHHGYYHHHHRGYWHRHNGARIWINLG